ncbi:tyrosine-type recombinase/integrase [Ottowia thiooxydans]|uniref:tyrosine-type recombinase/integrase n=1 Tax=Ottowia thiooxydans TaxID=219182 RepID=UPI000684C6EB|nr:tyrosine-type recombinase/integrase [Ottowia thiooxydans]
MASINTVGARDRLKPRREPYWHKLSAGCYLGYRRLTSESAGSWLARCRGDDEKQQYHALGTFDDMAPAMRFDVASKAAREWFEHLGRGGSTDEITVGEACRRYLKKLKEDGRDGTAKDAQGRFNRWVFDDKRLERLPLTKITPRVLDDWRSKLAGTLAMPQDKAKEATRKRSAASLNRDMSNLKAALNLALADGYITSSTAWDTKLRPVEAASGKREVYLDHAQRQKLVRHAASDIGTFIRAMSALPLRPGALAARTVADFEPRLKNLRIGNDKNGKPRTIPLPKETADFIAGQCKNKLPAAPIFARADGAAWNKDSWKGPMRDAVTAAELPSGATAYSLRHSTITDLISAHGLDLLTVAKLADTSLPMIEKHYGHLRQAHAANALAALAI